MKEVQLDRLWKLGKKLGGGGFGQVFHASDGEIDAVAKVVPKAPGANRELLFVNPEDVRNVVPVLDQGETDDSLVIVMSKAERSLRQQLETGPLSEAEAVPVLRDILESLEDMAGSITHRDIKPENILLLNGKWCLADFGISRYAEATTAPDTHKYAMTPSYTPPERWRSERATSKSDVYSVGITAYELVTGTRPFTGQDVEDLREQHISARPPRLTEVTTPFADLVDTMLYKAPDARPTPTQLLERLDLLSDNKPMIVIEALQHANSAEVERQAQESIQKAQVQAAMERRAQLQQTAAQSFETISLRLRDAITASAPTAVLAGNSGVSWFIRLSQATLEMPPIDAPLISDWDYSETPTLEVIATAELILRAPASVGGKEGRAHSLWYCDAQEEGQFDWFETGFMVSPLMQRSTVIEPFSLNPGSEASRALLPMMAEYQVAWPFTPLIGENLIEFVQRWGTWFAMSAEGYQPPTQMPERNTQGTWRRS